MQTKVLRLFGAAVLLAWTQGASAQTALPDLKGTWIGQAHAIIAGASPHHPGSAPHQPADTHRLREMTFTIKINGQDGRRVWGTFGSPFRTDEMIGSIALDGRTLYFVTPEGFTDGHLVGPDRMENCYRHIQPSGMVAACNYFERQK